MFIISPRLHSNFYFSSHYTNSAKLFFYIFSNSLQCEEYGIWTALGLLYVFEFPDIQDPASKYSFITNFNYMKKLWCFSISEKTDDDSRQEADVHGEWNELKQNAWHKAILKVPSKPLKFQLTRSFYFLKFTQTSYTHILKENYVIISWTFLSPLSLLSRSCLTQFSVFSL